MGVALNNAIPRQERDYTPVDDTQVTAPYRDGFYVKTDGDVRFSYKEEPTVKHTKTFVAGDTWFADEIYSIDATGTTATVTIIRLAK